MFNNIVRFISWFSDRVFFIFLSFLPFLCFGTWFFLLYYPRAQEQTALKQETNLLNKRTGTLIQRIATSRKSEYEARITECTKLTKQFSRSTHDVVQRCVAALEKSSLKLIAWSPQAEKQRYDLSETQLKIELLGTYHQYLTFLRLLPPQVFCKTCCLTKTSMGIKGTCILTIFARKNS